MGGAYVTASGPLREQRARRVLRGLILEDDIAFVDNKPYLSSLAQLAQNRTLPIGKSMP